ncbi:DUF647-domain-containing protein [Periconia macrospinosa]|uniref:DUF647-domain-containing protein n=1 Tax=Periconia macrospinosa TaxID=97972 RepID=A0A2V1EED2_9PLEO|nr:DUF647-domain-containing protein [Periconia macrospinosa]
MSSSIIFELVERDEAGNVTSTYIESASADSKSRVDIVLPTESKSRVQQLIDVFLPAGYPHSVTEDYIQYQIYDSLQAFSSSIAGMLSSRAVLEGVGVGDASASPTAALLLSVLQESMGRIATILFAHKLGTSLEPECKMYRLAADVLNDTAMVLDCLSPAFPKVARVMILSFSSILRSLCGVCAGSSKASLSAHFAKRGNLGELNAKDSSQETVISLLGMIAGSIVVSFVSTPLATWSTLLALLSIHLATNYAAVKAVSMRCLNRQRANIVLSNLLQSGHIFSPTEVSQKERIFEHDGVLRWTDDSIIGHCSVGMSMTALLNSVGAARKRANSLDLEATKVADLMHLYKDQGYVLWISQTDAVVVLKQGCAVMDQLQAWAQALLLAQRARTKPPGQKVEENASSGLLDELRLTLNGVDKLFEKHEEGLRNAGWDLDVAALEVRSGNRIEVGVRQR